MLSGFDQLVKSANRNAGMGSMNVEMAKAQLAQLIESFKGLDQNLKKEKDQMDAEHNTEKLNDFQAKCEDIQKKVPVVQSLWERLNDNANQEDTVFTQINNTLNSILLKEEVVQANNFV